MMGNEMPGGILYPVPTICDVLPAAAGAAGTACLRIAEDDWRQIEMVSRTLRDVARAELRAIRAIHEHHARRGSDGRLAGFETVHIRTDPLRPLPAPASLRQLLELLPAPDHRYDGVGFTGSAGAVAGSFAAAYGPLQIYGVAAGDDLLVAGLRRTARQASPSAGLVIALGRVMETFNTVVIDWCRCSAISTSSLAAYLAS
jgi:hypothetical protein